MNAESFLPTTILVPSLDRPQRIMPTIESIRAATPEPHEIVFCVSDSESITILNETGVRYLDDSADEDQRYVTRMNKLVRILDPSTRTVFFGSDDIDFHPGWLAAALTAMSEGPSVIVVNDLRNPNGTQAVVAVDYLAKAVFDAPGDAFHCGYLHNFADTEQFLTAELRGVFGRAQDSKVEHLNPVFGGGSRRIPHDSTYALAAEGWEQDRARFEHRVVEITLSLGKEDPPWF